MASPLIGQFDGAAAALDQAISEAYAVVLGPVDVQLFAHFGFYVENQSGSANAVESVIIETSPEASGRPWALLDEVLAAPLAAGAMAYGILQNQALKYIRVRAKCAAGETATANFWLCAQGYRS